MVRGEHLLLESSVVLLVVAAAANAPAPAACVKNDSGMVDAVDGALARIVSSSTRVPAEPLLSVMSASFMLSRALSGESSLSISGHCFTTPGFSRSRCDDVWFVLVQLVERTPD